VPARRARVRLLAALGSMAAVASLGLASAPPASASTSYVAPNMWQFDVIGTTTNVTITQCSPCLGAVTIPSTFTAGSTAYTVTAISDFANFSVNMTSLDIPSSVTSIGKGAFASSTVMTSVTLRAGLQSIGRGAFANTPALVAVNLPAGLQTIDDGAFQLSGLTAITIPTSVTTLGDYTFRLDMSLTSVTFQGAPPSTPNGTATLFTSVPATVVYVPSGAGWPSTFGGIPTAYSSVPAPAAPVVPAGPVEPPPPAPESLPPVAGVAPAAELAPGASSGSVNGAPVTTTVTVNPAGGVQVAGGGSTVSVADVGVDGLPLPATGGGLAGAPGSGLSVQASGFLPQSQADVYMYSEQLWLGKATVDAGGNVSMSLTIPSWVTPGGHTLQFVGYQGPYTSIALSTGITVAAPVAQVISARPASGEFTARFRRGSADLAPTARAGIRSAVNAAAKARAGATVTCTAIHLEPATASAGLLWVRREAAVNVFLSNAGCDTVTIEQGTLEGVSGQPGLAIRIAAVAG
jgi:hypothetical protein